MAKVCRLRDYDPASWRALPVPHKGSAMMQQQPQSPKPTLWDRILSESQGGGLRVYSPPPVTPASIADVKELVGRCVAFIKVVREADSQYGHSALIGVVVEGNDHTDTVWLNESTGPQSKNVLYKQVMSELRNGKFVAMISEVQSRANPQFTYYSLSDPNGPSAVEARVETLADLPF